VDARPTQAGHRGLRPEGLNPSGLPLAGTVRFLKESACVKEIDRETTTIVFDRTPIARLISLTAVFASGALFFDYLSRGAQQINPLALAGLATLLIGTILAALLQYGDHYYFSPDGVLYENRLLPFFPRQEGWLRWDDVVEVREIRRKILVLLTRDGRRMFVDAIAGYRVARNEILRRAPHAVVSGTLSRNGKQQ
jgi:hypothetical protein